MYKYILEKCFIYVNIKYSLNVIKFRINKQFTFVWPFIIKYLENVKLIISHNPLHFNLSHTHVSNYNNYEPTRYLSLSNWCNSYKYIATQHRYSTYRLRSLTFLYLYVSDWYTTRHRYTMTKYLITRLNTLKIQRITILIMS